MISFLRAGRNVVASYLRTHAEQGAARTVPAFESVAATLRTPIASINLGCEAAARAQTASNSPWKAFARSIRTQVGLLASQGYSLSDGGLEAELAPPQTCLDWTLADAGCC